MKMWKKLLTSLLTASLLLGLTSASALAAEEEYNYTVTFYAGNQGTFSGTAGLSVSGSDASISATADKIVVSGLKAGDIVGFNAQATVALADSSKYYVQGVRLSGRDNDTVAESVFEVNEDLDYVVAYGIQGNMTSYTVHYQDAEGNTLAESDVYYGNIGDKPVISYKYIEGYAPTVYGFTRTLSDNEAENVFTFVYEEAPEDTVIYEEETIEGTGTGDGTGTGGGAGGAGGAGTGDGSDDESVDDPDDEAADGSDDGTGDDAQGDDAQGEGDDDLVVDQDPEVPLDEDPAKDDDASSDAIPLIGSIAIAVVGIGALIALIIMLMKKRKNNN